MSQLLEPNRICSWLFCVFLVFVLFGLSAEKLKAEGLQEFTKELAKKPKAIETLKKGKATQDARVNQKIDVMDSKTKKVVKGNSKASKILRDKGQDARQKRTAAKFKKHINKVAPKNKSSAKLLNKASKAKKIAKVAKTAAKGGVVVGAALYAGKIVNCGKKSGSVGDKIVQAGKNLKPSTLGKCAIKVVKKDVNKTKKVTKKIACFGKNLFKKNKACK